MARPRRAGEKTGAGKRRVEQYGHKGQQRRNNPPVGLVTEATDRDAPRKRYTYDPHLDPTLTWAGKAEHASFELPTVSLPFEAGAHGRVAIKIVDDHSIESLKIIPGP
jgi:adenine-specific DNA-methyltransferase